MFRSVASGSLSHGLQIDIDEFKKRADQMGGYMTRKQVEMEKAARLDSAQ